MTENKQQNVILDYENKKNLLIKFYNIWARKLWAVNLVFFSLEINCKGFENYVLGTQKWFRSLLNELYILEFIEVVHGACNFNTSGLLQVQIILGFRSHFDNILLIRNKIEALFVFCKEESEFKLKYLYRFTDVLTFLCYLSRNFDKKRKFDFAFVGIYSWFNIKIHYDMFNSIECQDVDLGIDPTIFFIYYTGDTGMTSEYKLHPGKFHEIDSVPKFILQEEFGEILYYLIYYFQKQNIIIYKKKLYLYNKKTGWSNEMLSIFEFFIKEEIMNILIEIKNFFDFINIERLYFLFSKHNKALIIKLIFYFKNKNNVELTSNRK